MKRPELLSPAGNMECLKAAITAGCDAVYLGGKSFGARNYASNFSDSELIEAISYAHIYGVKVYVTVNTLIFENEVNLFMEYIDFLHRNNVDAIIIQDLGMLDLVKQTYPNLEIHASTQMHIHNIEGVKLVQKLGVERVVLARETSIEEIEKIKKETQMDLEVFIHGALCISYSGQCLMSYFKGGRSGNRGSCAQCCRMPYDLIQNDKKVNHDQYLLSTKDLCTIQEIGKLIEIGVDSLKIEGRMKRPEYVYIVTKLYRMAIDQYIENKKVLLSNQDFQKLLKIFNRKFTKGFLFHESNDTFTNSYRPNHMGIKIGKVISKEKKFVSIQLEEDIHQEDGIRILNKNQDFGCTLNKIYKNRKLVHSAKKGEIITLYIDAPIRTSDVVIKTTDKMDMEFIQKQLLENPKKIDVFITLKCLLNQPLEITITDLVNTIHLQSDYICTKAKNSPTSKERIEKQINRFHDTAYRIKELKIELDSNIFIDIKELNQLRRQIIEKLNDTRCYQIPYQKKNYKRPVTNYKNSKKLSVSIDNPLAIKELENFQNIRIYSKTKQENIVYSLPRIMQKFHPYLEELLIGELGSLYYYSNVITDFSFNVTNSYAVALLNHLGAKLITLSYENTEENIIQIINNYKKRYNQNPNLEKIISSYPEVMISKFKLLKKYQLKNEGFLKGFKNNIYKIKENNDFMTIYHHEKIVDDSYQKYYDMGIESLRVEYHDSKDLELIQKIHKNLQKKEK